MECKEGGGVANLDIVGLDIEDLSNAWYLLQASKSLVVMTIQSPFFLNGATVGFTL